jgi:hypothetical protein
MVSGGAEVIAPGEERPGYFWVIPLGFINFGGSNEDVVNVFINAFDRFL